MIDLYTPSNKLKMLGFRQAVKELGLMEDPWIYESESTLKGAYDVTKRIIKEHPDVDGIIYSVDLLATSGVRALVDMNVRIPQQVSVIGIDNSIYAEICNPKLTSLDNKLLDLSITSARILIDALKKRPISKKILIFSSIAERETT